MLNLNIASCVSGLDLFSVINRVQSTGPTTQDTTQTALIKNGITCGTGTHLSTRINLHTKIYLFFNIDLEMYLLANLTVIAGEKKDKPIGVNYFDTFKYEGTCSGPGENNPPRIETYAPRPGDTVYRAEFYNKDLHAYIYAGLVKVQQNGANSYGMMPVSICDCELVQNGNVIQSVVFNQWSLSSRHVNHISYDSRLVPSTSLTDFEQSKHHLPSLACLGQYVSPSDLCLPPPNHSVKIKQYVPPSNMPPLDSCISEIDLPCSSQTDLSYGESQNNQPAREYGDTTISPDDDYDDVNVDCHSNASSFGNISSCSSNGTNFDYTGFCSGLLFSDKISNNGESVKRVVYDFRDQLDHNNEGMIKEEIGSPIPYEMISLSVQGASSTTDDAKKNCGIAPSDFRYATSCRRDQDMDRRNNNCGFNAIISQLHSKKFGGDRLKPGSERVHDEDTKERVKEFRNMITDGMNATISENIKTTKQQDPEPENSISAIKCRVVGSEDIGGSTETSNATLQIDSIHIFAKKFQKVFIVFDEQNRMIYILPTNGHLILIANSDEINSTADEFNTKRGDDTDIVNALGVSGVENDSTVMDMIVVALTNPDVIALKYAGSHYYAMQPL